MIRGGGTDTYRDREPVAAGVARGLLVESIEPEACAESPRVCVSRRCVQRASS